MATIPNTNINLATNIRDVLNADGGSVNNDLTSFFKPAAKVKMWNKFKPVKYADNFPTYPGTWWKATNGLCGIAIPNGSGSAGLDSIKNSVWTWDYPTGGTSQPMRLGDFRGYNTACTTDIFQSHLKSDISVSDKKIHVALWIYDPQAITNHLRVPDCTLWGNFRLGVRIVYGSNTYIQTSAKTASQVYADSGVLNVDIDLSASPFNSNPGTYKITQFLTTENYSTIGTFPTIITCYSIPRPDGYVNEATVTWSGDSGFVMNVDGLASTLNGTYYNPYSFDTTNPFKVSASSSYTQQFFRIQIENNTSATVSFSVYNFLASCVNLVGDEVTVDFSSTSERDYFLVNLYNSSKTQIYTTNIAAGAKGTYYLGIRLFNQGKNHSIIGTGSTGYNQKRLSYVGGRYKNGSAVINWGVNEIYIQGTT